MTKEKDRMESEDFRWMWLIIGVLFIASSVGIGIWFLKNKPTAKRRKAISLIPKVQLQEIKNLDTPVIISAMGVIIPSKKATLRARINGEVQKIHKDLDPGGIVNKGDTILWIDAADYKLKVQVKEAALKKFESALLLELVQQKIAESQLKSYKYKQSENLDRDMILRKPQERSCRADIMAAKADLDAAKLDLSRTSIKAPFNAVILERDVDVGEQAVTSRILVIVVDINTYWIKVSIPVNSLKWIEFPTEGHEGSEVEINCRRGIRKGRVLRLMSSLDTKGRMAQILVEVKDPLDLESLPDKRVPLLLQEYVRVSIKGKMLKNVVKIPRKAFHNNQNIWLMTPSGRLDIVDVTAVWDVRNSIYVYKKNLPEGKLIISDLGFPVKGMAISAVEKKDQTKVVQIDKEDKAQ